MPNLLNADVKEMAQRSVLCWLATADEDGQPNVSPKEVFSVVDDAHIVVANIASPNSSRNIQINPKVCLSFIDVFVQKGFKVHGTASYVSPSQTEYARWVAPLRMMVGERFPIHSVFVIRAEVVAPIMAPSYRFYPQETTQASQVQSALRAYGVAHKPDSLKPASDLKR